MKGELGILNVGAGDTKLTFDPDNPAERERAAATVMDMLKRGYAIMVQVGEKDGKPLYQRAETFDPKTCEYIIAGLPEADQDEPEDEAQEETADRKPQKPRRGRIRANSTRGVAVAPIAGG